MEYLHYWSFTEPPFGPSASRFFFWGQPQHQTLAWVQDVVVSVEAIGVIATTGGCGISTLLQQIAMSRGFDGCATEVVLTNGRHSSVQAIHGQLAQSMGVSVNRDALSAIAAAFDVLHRRSIRPVWLIDDLGKHAAQAVIQTIQHAAARCPSLTVIGSVTPRLHRLVVRQLESQHPGSHRAHWRASQDRIAQTHFADLDRQQVLAFIQHSIAAAGGRRNPFTADAIDAIEQQSDGRIGRIKRIAQAALVAGAALRLKQITSAEIQSAAPANDAAA